jgi:hypothetical protein
LTQACNSKKARSKAGFFFDPAASATPDQALITGRWLQYPLWQFAHLRST